MQRIESLAARMMRKPDRDFGDVLIAAVRSVTPRHHGGGSTHTHSPRCCPLAARLALCLFFLLCRFSPRARALRLPGLSLLSTFMLTRDEGRLRKN